MAGLYVLFVIWLYFWLIKKWYRRSPPGWKKKMVIIAAILIPTTDAVVGRYWLDHLCDTEGGMKIYRVVENVEGFRGGQDFYLDLYFNNYLYLEGNGSPYGTGGGLYLTKRWSRQADGTVKKEENVTPISPYAYKKGFFTIFPIQQKKPRLSRRY